MGSLNTRASCSWLGSRNQRFEWVILGVRVKIAAEQRRLHHQTASLHVIVIAEAVREIRTTPIPAPNQTMCWSDHAKEAEVSLPGRITIDIFHQIARQSIMMDPDDAKLRCTLLEQHLLPFLATIGFENHEFDAPCSCICDDSLNRSPRNRLKQGWIGDPILRMKALVLLNHVSKEICHDKLLKQGAFKIPILRLLLSLSSVVAMLSVSGNMDKEGAH